MTIEFAEDVKEILRAAGYSDEEIRAQEATATKHQSQSRSHPIEPVQMEPSRAERFTDEALFPMGGWGKSKTAQFDEDFIIQKTHEIKARKERAKEE